MARDYARIMTAIWDNREFCNLGEAAQRAYLLLVTQPDISAAGVLRLWVPRWVQMSRTSDLGSFTRSLKELEMGRFIVQDEQTGELLIRSFIRWDAGFNNPKRRPVIVQARKDVRSELIARHLEVEFRRCGLLPDSPPPPNGGVAVSHPDTELGSPSSSASSSPSSSPSDSLSGSHRVDPGKEPFPQVDSLTPSLGSRLTPSYALEEGLAVTYLRGGIPQSLNPATLPPSAGGAGQIALIDDTKVINGATEVINAGHVVAAWAEGFATTGNQPVPRLRKQVGKEAKELLEAGNNPHRVMAAARILGNKGRGTLVAELAIQSQHAGVPSGRISPSDQNIIDIQSLKSRFSAPGSDSKLWQQIQGGTA